MNTHGIKRIICLSAGAVIVPPKANVFAKFFIKNVLQKIFAHLYSDMLIMEQRLRATSLDYTIIRAPWLRDTKRKGVYRTAINEHLDSPSKISRLDLAGYMIDQLANTEVHRATVEISY